MSADRETCIHSLAFNALILTVIVNAIQNAMQVRVVFSVICTWGKRKKKFYREKKKWTKNNNKQYIKCTNMEV